MNLSAEHYKLIHDVLEQVARMAYGQHECQCLGDGVVLAQSVLGSLDSMPALEALNMCFAAMNAALENAERCGLLDVTVISLDAGKE